MERLLCFAAKQQVRVGRAGPLEVPSLLQSVGVRPSCSFNSCGFWMSFKGNPKNHECQEPVLEREAEVALGRKMGTC